MPYYETRKKPQQVNGTGTISARPAGSVAPSNPFGGGGGGAKPNPTQNPNDPSNATNGQRGPTGWVNLQEYYGLNQPQAEGMVDKVAGGVEKKATGAQQAVQNASNQFNAQSKAGTTQNPYQYARTGNYGVDYGTTAEQAQKNATKGYTGPSSLNDINSGLDQQVSDAQEAVDLAGSYSGRDVLLGNEYGGDRGQGVNALDNFLMEQSEGGRFGDIQDSWGDLAQQYGAARERAGQQAEAARGASEAAGKNWSTIAGKVAEEDAAIKARNDADALKREADAQRASDQARIDAQAEKGDEVRSVSDEQYALSNGLSLEEWIAAGRPRTKKEWEDYRSKKNATE